MHQGPKNIDNRFYSPNSLSSPSISGKWEVDFGYNTSDKYKAIGVFKHEKKQFNRHIHNRKLVTTGTFKGIQLTIPSFYLVLMDHTLFCLKAKLENEELKWCFFIPENIIKIAGKLIGNSSFLLSNPDSITKINTEFPVSFSFS